MEASRKRPLSPDPDAADQQTRFARDPSAALATFAPAPPSDRFNLPPLSSLTAFAGVPPPQLFVGSEQTPANVSNKRLRLDDDAGSQELFQGRRQSISMQGMQELPGIASITGRPGQITGQQLPPFQAGLESAPGTPGGDSEHRSAHPGQTSLPSFKTFGQEALGNLLGPGHFNSSDQSRFAGGSGSPHYSAPASTLGTAASSSLTSAAAAASSRMTLPPFNASSPVSKVPKPPSTILYKREPSSSSVTSGVGSLTRVPLPGSPLVSPILNPAAAPIPPPPASFFHSTSMSSPFSSGAFGVPPYGTNYYSSNMKRMEAERRDPSTVLSKLPPMSSLPGSRAASDLGEAESMHGSHSRRLAHRRGGAADVDDDDGSDGSNSDDLQMIDARTGKIRSQPDSDTGETLGRVLNMGSRKADMEKAKEEAKRKRKPGDVAVVNDERLTRVPRNMEEKHLGHIVYAGPRVRRPGCCRVEDVKLCLLPVFNSDHHYATIEIRIPAYLLTFKSNVAARLSAVWGTDVYTDDSDVVAMILHSGWYKAIDSPDLDRARLKANLSEPRPQESQVPLVTVKEEPSPADLGNPLDPAEATSNGTSTRPVTPVRTLPVPPLAPVMGTLDPSDGLPSHDLHVVLRILPRLVKYTGSLRNGVESRGWGSGHDGKSLRIERVFAVEKGSVSRHGKKAGVRMAPKGTLVGHDNRQRKDVTVVFSESGEACFKYKSSLLTDNPPHKAEQFRSKPSSASEAPDHTRKWPFWRTQLLKHSLVLEEKGSRRYELTCSTTAALQPATTASTASKTDTYRILELDTSSAGHPNSALALENVAWHDIRWTDTGLYLPGERKIPVARFFWKRRTVPPSKEQNDDEQEGKEEVGQETTMRTFETISKAAKTPPPPPPLSTAKTPPPQPPAAAPAPSGPMDVVTESGPTDLIVRLLPTVDASVGGIASV